MQAITARGIPVPAFIYGTAWKEADTQRQVEQALRVGFRGIDTANQRKHYFEAGVGAAIKAAFAEGLVRRDELFVQTKFTFADGQDHRLPYDENAAIPTQVRQSFASSLEHLGLTTIDSLVLHGPSRRFGLGSSDFEAWETFEELQQKKAVRLLGISNVSAEQLSALCQKVKVPPAFVQNRCYARTRWDADVREICRTHGIVYQAFSLLTGNPQVLARHEVRSIAAHHGVTEAQVVFRFAHQLGMLPLTGSSDARHLAQDLRVFEFELDAAHMRELGG